MYIEEPSLQMLSWIKLQSSGGVIGMGVILAVTNNVDSSEGSYYHQKD